MQNSPCEKMCWARPFFAALEVRSPGTALGALLHLNETILVDRVGGNITTPVATEVNQRAPIHGKFVMVLPGTRLCLMNAIVIVSANVIEAMFFH